MADGTYSGVRSSWAGRAVHNIDQPENWIGTSAVLALVVAIYVSVIAWVVEMRWPDWAISHELLFDWIEYVVLAVFVVELSIRLAGYRRPFEYLWSWNGLIDLAAIAPALVGLMYPTAPSTLWLRVLRLLRLLRLLKFIETTRRANSVFDGVTRRIAPALALAVGVKGVMVAAEAQAWWPHFADLTIVIGVAGFAIGILLGTKLGIANRRLYDVEDALCRVVGALRDIPRDDPEVLRVMRRFATRLYVTLAKNRTELFGNVRRATVAMEYVFEKHGIGGPTTAGLHRDLEFVLHRIHARTPPAYERFLRAVTIVYSAIVVVVVPGLIGFFAVLLVVYVLGGMYVVIDDMDRPLEADGNSLVSIDLEPLAYLLREGILRQWPKSTSTGSSERTTEIAMA